MDVDMSIKIMRDEIVEESKVNLEMQNLRKTTPHENKLDIVFEHISYSVDVVDDQAESSIPCKSVYKKKEILKDVSGIFKAGRVTAIMGASGAGKTTLLNVLACRISPTGKDSRLYANRLQYDYDAFGDFANYVMQQDLLMQTMTVRETLEFAAQLKLSQPEEQRREVIKQLTRELKLEKCLDTLVGGVMIKGISGGERKRTSIAFELISDPQVLFLDEPTSGLDSLTSYIIVSYLKKLAHSRNKTIIMTIHQPNSETFELFDDLTVLLEGRLIYQAPSRQVEQYFSKHFALECPQFVNPSDFFMSKIHYEDESNRERYPQYFEAYSKNIAPTVQKAIQSKETSEVKMRQPEVSTFSIISALLWRLLLNMARNPMLFKAKVMQGVVISLFVGGMYFDAGTLDVTVRSSFNYVTGFLFFITIGALMTVLSPIALEFPLQKAVFYKEQDSKLYSLFHFFLAKNLIEIPEIILVPLLTTCPIYYFMVDLDNSASKFFIHVLTYLLISFCGASIGLLIGSAAKDAKDVSPIISLVMLPVITFAGFFKNRADLPVWIGWVEYLSPNKYGFNAFAENEFEGRDSLIGTLNLEFGLWTSILILFGLGVCYRIVAFVILGALSKKSQ